ncbi:MAG: substrate-binding domain-containing protein [Chitinophagaceae bacterium]|nr:substrate-binding domain-containing protein [Chitinophagaceae bacterium]
MKKKLPTELSGIKEIARRANVSIATVDRVIHKRTGVSLKTRDKINKIISDLDYQPNLLARRLASRKTIRIATLIPKIGGESSFWEAPLRGIEQAESELRQMGIIIEKFFFDQEDSETFIKQSRLLLRHEPDGILIAPSFVDEAIEFTTTCKERHIPFVYINSDIPEQKSLCYIGPDLYRSGYLAGNLISYLVNDNQEILITNVTKELEDRHHLVRKEEGLRAYFADHKRNNVIRTIDVLQFDADSIESALSLQLNENKNIGVVFVTNSRVASVANYLKSFNHDVLLVGYDFLKENIEYLNEGVIDFLICQKPVEQAYRGVMSLYQHLVLSTTVEDIYLMPIDIITKENYAYYRN